MAIDREWMQLTVDKVDQERHQAILKELLYSKEYQQSENRAHADDIHQHMIEKHRMERLYYAQGLKAHHEKQLHEEIKYLQKQVNDAIFYTRQTMDELRPKALVMMVKEFMSIATSSSKGKLGLDDDDDDDDDEEEEEEEEGEKKMHVLSSLSPPSKRMLDSTPPRPTKKGKRQGGVSGAGNLLSDLGGEGAGGAGEGVEQMVKGAINREMLKRQVKGAIEDARRENEEAMQRKWQLEFERQLKMATKAVQDEMKEEFETQLEEEKERARIMMEVQHDLEKKELEERIRAECQQEIANIMKQVGLKD